MIAIKSEGMRTTLLRTTANVKEAGVVEFVGSTPSVDRDGDTILQNWDVSAYLMNPVVLYCHDRYAPPIGRALSVGVVDGVLKFAVQFVPSEIYPFADQIRRMYEAGYMSAVSVGFRVMESAPNGYGGQEIRRSELLELSCVTIPANAEALMTRAAGTVRPVFPQSPVKAPSADTEKINAWFRRTAQKGAIMIAKKDAPAQGAQEPAADPMAACAACIERAIQCFTPKDGAIAPDQHQQGMTELQNALKLMQQDAAAEGEPPPKWARDLATKLESVLVAKAKSKADDSSDEDINAGVEAALLADLDRVASAVGGNNA